MCTDFWEGAPYLLLAFQRGLGPSITGKGIPLYAERPGFDLDKDPTACKGLVSEVQTRLSDLPEPPFSRLACEMRIQKTNKQAKNLWTLDTHVKFSYGYENSGLSLCPTPFLSTQFADFWIMGKRMASVS